jgi:hypothetical protein
VPEVELAAWLFRPVGIFLINYAVMPFLESFVLKQMAYTRPLVLIVGLTTAYMYRTGAQSAGG